MKPTHTLSLLLFCLLFLCGLNAQKQQIPVVFYLQNMPVERIGTETDQEIMNNLSNEGFIVIPVDCSNYAKTSPGFEKDLVNFHSTVSDLLAPYATSTTEPDFYSVYYVPEGYTLKKGIPVWNIKDHGTDSSMEYIMDTWNNEMVNLYGVAPVTRPEDMTDMNGNPLDLNMRMDLIYPTGNASKNVPLVINLATGSPRQRMFNPLNVDEQIKCRSMFPFGFLSTGYAWAHVDHCFNPLVRGEVWPKFFSRSSLDDYDGLALNTAYIRYLKLHAEQYNLNGKIGLMGISKAAYAATRLANKKNAEQEEHLPPFNGGIPNTKPQPWQGVESTVDVVYSAAGNGTRRVPQYVDENTVPMITSAGLFDQYGQWDIYPRVIKHFQDNDYIHLSMWMEELGHTYPGMGVDYLTGIDRYVLFKKYFDNFLKTSTTDPLEVFYALPKENSLGVDQKGYDMLVPKEEILPSSMLGIIPFEAITIRFLTEIDTVGVSNYLKVYNKTSNQVVAGTWNTRMKNTCFIFEPEEDLKLNETYVLEASKGIKGINGQELKEDFSREFTVSIYRESVLPGNKYAVHEAQRLADDITAGMYDVYELTTSGGNYVVSFTGAGGMTPSKSFTLKAAAGLAEKPKISVNRPSSSTTTYLFLPSDTITMTFEGLEFTGENQAGLDKGQPNFCRIAGGRENTQIIIKECYFHSFSNAAGLFRIDAAGTSLDIQESLFKNNNTHIINFQATGLKYGGVILKNNTFSDNLGTRSLINQANSASGTNILIEHCTVNNFQGTSNVFNLKSLTGSLQIKNSIFTNIANGFSFSSPTPVIDACYLDGFATLPTGVITNSFTGNQPVYADPDNAHYGLNNKNLYVCQNGLPAGNSVYYLDTPVALDATDVASTGFTANWEAVKHAKGYEVFLYTGSSFVEYQLTASNELSVTFTDLVEGNDYSYKVVAKNNGVGFDSGLSSGIFVRTLSTGLFEEEGVNNRILIKDNELILPEKGSLEVFNLQGMLLSKKTNIETFTPNLKSDLYIVRYISVSGKKINQKIYIR